jgi:hypothetical protein
MKSWSKGMMGREKSPDTSSLQDSKRSVLFAMATVSNDSPLAAELKKVAGLKIKFAEPLARYTSM